MEKTDKRLEHLEEKLANKDDNTKKNTLEGEIPSQIKTSKNHVIVALRDVWLPTMNKRFDSIESKFDSIESRFDSIESILKK